MTITGTKQTEVTDFAVAWRQYVLEEATNELLDSHRAVLHLISGGLFVGESDVAVFQLAQPVVTEGDAEDIRSKILEGLLATTDWCGVDYPALRQTCGSTCANSSVLFNSSRNLARKILERALTGTRKSGREATQRPSSVRPPPVTMKWTCG